MGLNEFQLSSLERALAALRRSGPPWEALAPLSGLAATDTDVIIDLSASERLGAPVILARPRLALPAGLTTRQGQIARACARGLSNKEIARELGLSPATVKDHVAAILARLGLRNRREIAPLMSGLSHRTRD